MILRTLGRMIWVPLALLIAATCSVAMLLWLGSERVTHAMHGRTGFDLLDFVQSFIGAAAPVLAAATLIPAVLVVIIGEVVRIRSALYYVIGGGAAMAAIPLIARLGAAGQQPMPPAVVWQIFATAGFLGGLVYWALAGRRS